MTDFLMWLAITAGLFGLMITCYHLLKKDTVESNWTAPEQTKRPPKKKGRNKVKCNTESEYLMKKSWEDPPHPHIKPS